MGYERIQEFLDPESVSQHRRAAASQRGKRASESSNTPAPTTTLEYIFSMLSEAATTEIAIMQDHKCIDGNKTAEEKGDRVAKGAREKLEAEIGVDMPMPENCIERPDNRKGLK